MARYAQAADRASRGSEWQFGQRTPDTDTDFIVRRSNSLLQSRYRDVSLSKRAGNPRLCSSRFTAAATLSIGCVRGRRWRGRIVAQLIVSPAALRSAWLYHPSRTPGRRRRPSLRYPTPSPTPIQKDRRSPPVTSGSIAPSTIRRCHASQLSPWR